MTPFDADLAESNDATRGKIPRASASLAIPPTDGERLLKFRLERDEAAFHDVVRAHAPLVWGICWQILRHRQDVEDAFQATFLILARKAASIRATDSAAGWLYRVAFRTALAARARRRRLGHDALAEEPPAPLEDQLAAIARSEQCEKLLEELHALATRYRQPLVLCYLEGRSRQEAADELGLTAASVKGRLARGLRMLRSRLAHRGLALSGAAALLAREMATAQASVTAAPIAETAALATGFAWPATAAGTGTFTAAGTGSAAFTLAKKGLLAMQLATAAKPVIGLLAMGVTAGAIALAAADGSGPGDGGAGRASATSVVELVALADDGAATSATRSADDAFDPAVSGFAAASTTAGADELLSERAATSTTTARAADDPFGAAATTSAATAADNPFGAGTPTSATASTTTPAAADPLVPAEPALTTSTWATAAAAAEPPQDVLIPATTPVAAPVQAPLPQVAQPYTYAAAAPIGSREVMLLEREYWERKGRGLRLKAEALQNKRRGGADSNAISQVEQLEIQAEAELMLAEAILCDARKQQLSEAIDSQPTSATYAPPATTMPPPQVDFPAGPQPSTQWQATPAPTTNPPTASYSDPAMPSDPLAAPANDLERMTKELQQQFAQLRAQNEALRRELDALRRQQTPVSQSRDPRPEPTAPRPTLSDPALEPSVSRAF
jgi:RNA polymerase sigma factor (sigma-70 family)